MKNLSNGDVVLVPCVVESATNDDPGHVTVRVGMPGQTSRDNKLVLSGSETIRVDDFDAAMAALRDAKLTTGLAEGETINEFE